MQLSSGQARTCSTYPAIRYYSIDEDVAGQKDQGYLGKSGNQTLGFHFLRSEAGQIGTSPPRPQTSLRCLRVWVWLPELHKNACFKKIRGCFGGR